MLIIETLVCEEYSELIDKIVDCYESDISKRYEINVIAKYDDAVEIIGALVTEGFSLRNIEISEEALAGYKKEYVITVSDCEVWCEPMCRKDKYIQCGCDFAFVMSECSSDVLKYLGDAKITIVELVGWDEFLDGVDDWDSPEDLDDGGKPCDVDIKLIVNGKEIAPEDIEKTLKKLNNIYDIWF